MISEAGGQIGADRAAVSEAGNGKCDGVTASSSTVIQRQSRGARNGDNLTGEIGVDGNAEIIDNGRYAIKI